MFNAIIFDLDGTLIDSSQDIRFALNKLLTEYHCEEISNEHIYHFLKKGARWMIREALLRSKKQLADHELDELFKKYLLYYQADPVTRTKIYPGVVDTLSYLKNEKIKLGICTNKPSIMTNIVLERLQLSHFFEAVVAAEDTTLLKPHPEHIHQTLLKMNVLPEFYSALVGDSDDDVLAARNANIPVIAVKYGYYGNTIESAYPDACINDLFSLPVVLKQLFDSKYLI